MNTFDRPPVNRQFLNKSGSTPPVVQPCMTLKTVQPGARYVTTTVERKYASIWMRLLAHVIDNLLLTFGMCAVAIAVGFAVGFAHLPAWPFTILVYLLSIIATWVYYTTMESSASQATVGKIAMGLKVIDEDGQKISFARANGRFFGKILSALPLNIGFLMIGFTQKKQGLHDVLAGTYVVDQS